MNAQPESKCDEVFISELFILTPRRTSLVHSCCPHSSWILNLNCGFHQTSASTLPKNFTVGLTFGFENPRSSSLCGPWVMLFLWIGGSSHSLIIFELLDSLIVLLTLFQILFRLFDVHNKRLSPNSRTCHCTGEEPSFVRLSDATSFQVNEALFEKLGVSQQHVVENFVVEVISQSAGCRPSPCL